VFEIGDRDRVRGRVLDMAAADARVVAGAVLGSLAHDEGDRWSDLDLMFAVANDASVDEVLEAWSQTLAREFGAVRLFDLPSGSIIYRVFLFPDCLELDLSFTPASQFRAGGPKFRLLFGEAVEESAEPPDAADELFGYAVHHCTHERPSSEDGIGRPSTGSVPFATRRSPLPVGGGASTAGTAGSSTDCLPKSWVLPTMRSCDRSTQTNSTVH